jgi:uncharacterized protein (TIGR00288 family)
MGSTLRQIALLIDADNVAGIKEYQLEIAVLQLKEFGNVTVRRAYGNWRKSELNSLKEMLPKFAIFPVQQFDYTKGKNATDIALTIDAMDLMNSGNFDAFCIISCDSDFTPLAVRLRNAGLAVYGFGLGSKTSEAFQKSCTRFFVMDMGQQLQPVNPTTVSLEQRTSSDEVTATETSLNSTACCKTEVEAIFLEAVGKNLNDSGWANTKAVANYLSQHDKRKKDYKAQTWAKYYQKFPEIFDVKSLEGKTLIRLR